MSEPPARAASTTPTASPVKALLFDVFGTLVDWRRGVAREAQTVAKLRGLSLDGLAFADAWRDLYQPSMEEVRSGRQPYAKLDRLHRQTLDSVLPRFGLEMLGEEERQRLTLAWHRLDAWTDVPAGLERLRQRFLIAPLSNGNVALMVDLARHNDLRWDAILGADLARTFKPMPAVYLAAADALNLEPRECMMCAAHSGDLAAAAAAGLRTAFIARPQERPGVAESEPKVPVDVVCGTTLDLARELSA